MDVYLIPAVDPYYSVVHLGRLNPVIDTNGSHDVPYSSGGFNQPGVWVVQGYSLDDYVGYGYRLEFIFNTYDKNYNAFRGWLIDDVNVSFDEAYPVPLIYNVQPSSGGMDSAVYVYGSGFMSSAQVAIGGMHCSNVTVINDGLIVLSLPSALSAGMHNVTVTNPTNTSYTLSNAFDLVSTSTTTTTTTSSTTTTGSCMLAGDNPPCGVVTVPEILSAITLWAQGNMTIADVLNLITAWANG